MKVEQLKPDIRLRGKQDVANIAILSAIALAIGIYLIATTVLIAKDGILYIECAKQIADSPFEAVRDMLPCPGYPFLIYLMHEVVGLFSDSESIQGWIVAAQAVSLLSKVIAFVALYFVGSCLIGPRMSFWGVAILSILPDPAAFGSDVLPEWPHLMFLTTGFLLLLLGAQYRKNWMFGWAGIIAGLSYLVRSEGCQLILYGGAWLLFNIIRPQGKMKRSKAAGGLILLLAGFAVVAVPYMRSKGHVFPDQVMWELPAFLSSGGDNHSPVINANTSFAGLSIKGIIGDETLITNVCETLMYYFVPALLIGCYFYFRKHSRAIEHAFFASSVIIFNIAMPYWQSSKFLSRRHTLVLVVFTIFYIPLGLQTIARWLGERSRKNHVDMEKHKQNWFLVLLAIGIVVCLPKLFRPLRMAKQDYRAAAMWLRENTEPTDIVIVPDERISFYAERNRIDNAPASACYIVTMAGEASNSQTKVAFFDVHIAGSAVERPANKKLFLHDFRGTNHQTVTLQFTAPPGQAPCQFRTYLFAGYDATLQAVDLQSVGPEAQAKESLDLLSGDYAMATLIGVIDYPGHQIKAERTAEGFLAYGPYIPLEEGEYSVTFRLKLDNPKTTKVWSSSTGKRITIYRRI